MATATATASSPLRTSQHSAPAAVLMGAAQTTPKRINTTQPFARKGSLTGTVVSMTANSSNAALSSAQQQQQPKRLYRAGGEKWVTRDIASLDFLLGIPLAAEQEIVTTGWQLQLQKDAHDDNDSSSSDDHQIRGTREIDYLNTVKDTWWKKWINNKQQLPSSVAAGNSSPSMMAGANSSNEKPKATTDVLERPTEADAASAAFFINNNHQNRAASNNTNSPFLQPSYAAPGRRLEGDDAIRIQIPLTVDTVTKQRSIARQAALREWELQTAHGLGSSRQLPPLLDGRLFFSADSSYPVSVFSIIRYEPKKEEAAIRRRKLEAIGGGGSEFVMPVRDWRGISYRALLRYRSGDETDEKAFNRFVRNEDNPKNGGDGKGDGDDDNASTSSSSTSSSEASYDYEPGILDDPAMVLGRHRNVMVGDRVTGPIVSSTIQFVKPTLLKAELNKQFRERFDGWEPPKSARKYIGAKVIQGNYVLCDPAEDYDEQSFEPRRRKRQGSVTSMGSTSDKGQKEIRMPPSLTLSKIRSLKQQALQAAVNAKLEIGTVALACVYFERLCLDCRVDKSNRRLSFAACLLLASKINEPNDGLVMQDQEDKERKDKGLQYWIRPNKRSTKMFASLLEFFTQAWSLSLKHLFNAEWGVFAALGFSLHATPSQVAFHFKRLMKTLEWNQMDYLGSEMYGQWQHSLADEEESRIKRERRKEERRQRKEERLLNLHIEIENEVLRRKTDRTASGGSGDNAVLDKPNDDSEILPTSANPKKERRIKLFNRFGLRRAVSSERLVPDSHSQTDKLISSSAHPDLMRRRSVNGALPMSPSMPTINTAFSDTGILAIDMPDITGREKVDASSVSSQDGSYSDQGIMV